MRESESTYSEQHWRAKLDLSFWRQVSGYYKNKQSHRQNCPKVGCISFRVGSAQRVVILVEVVMMLAGRESVPDFQDCLQPGIPANSLRSGTGFQRYQQQSHKKISASRHYLGIISTSQSRSYLDRIRFQETCFSHYDFLNDFLLFLSNSAAFFLDFSLSFRELEIARGKLLFCPLEQEFSILSIQSAALVKVHY